MVGLILAKAGLVRIARPLSDVYVAGRLMPGLFNSLAIAVSVLSILVFVGAAGGVGQGWEGIGAVLFGGGLGLILAGVLIAPYLRSFGGYTLADFFAERFADDGIRPLAVLAIVICSFPALAVVLLAFGLIASATFGLQVSVGVAAGVAMIFVATLRAGMRSLSLSQIAYYAVMLAASIVAILVVLWQTGTLFEADLLLVDEVLPTLPFEFFAQTSPLNTVALMFCLATGVASMPYILMRSVTTPSERATRGSFVAAPIFLGLLCLALPAFAALYETVWVQANDALYMTAEAILVVAGLTGLLAAGSALTVSIANALSFDIYYKSLSPLSTVRHQLLVARLSVIVVAGLAAIAAVAVPAEALIASGAALSLAASAFFPVLVLGIWWKRVTGDAAVAGMVTGLVVCLFYMIAPQFIPFAFYESSSYFSDATAIQAEKYEALRHSYYLAADGAAKEAVLAEWKTLAQALANWGGIRGAFAGLFAVPAGFIVIVVVSLFAGAPSDAARRFMDQLRVRTA